MFESPAKLQNSEGTGIPRLSRRTLMTAALLLGVSLLVPLPSFGRPGWVIMDLFHVPAFVILALITGTLFQDRMRARPVLRIVALWIGISLAGGLFEWLQGFSGRSANWHDAFANCAGAAAGLLILEARWTGQVAARRGLYLAGTVIAFVGASDSLGQLSDVIRQYRSVPRLSSFETDVELQRWSVKQHTIASRTCKQATHGESSLQIELQPDGYSGVDLRWPWPRWAEFKEFVFDVRLDAGPRLELTVKVFDREHTRRGFPHDDRFHRTVILSPGWQTVTIPLRQIRKAPSARLMNLHEIAGVEFFVSELGAVRTLHLDHLRLR